MRTINKKLKQLKGENPIETKTAEKLKEQPFKYKNYLNEVKMNRTANTDGKIREIHLIESIISKPNMTQEDKFY